MSAIVQYMKHHYEAEGMESPEIIDLAKEEMSHAETNAERIDGRE